MDESIYLVYKITMPANVNITNDVYAKIAPFSVQPLLCAYCVLERWEHFGLASPYWRWYWNNKPGASIGFDDKCLPLDPQHIVLVPPNTGFSTYSERGVGHFYYHFWLSTRLVSLSAKPIRLPISLSDQAELRSLVRSLTRGAPAHQEPNVSMRILAFAASALARGRYEWDIQSHDPVIDQVLRRLYAEVSNRALSNSTLAKEMGLTVNTLLRRFLRATGTSPRQFLIQLRIERGAELLRLGSMNIPDIAIHCGFVDRYHFTRAFTSHVGTSPACFRKQIATSETR